LEVAETVAGALVKRSGMARRLIALFPVFRLEDCWSKVLGDNRAPRANFRLGTSVAFWASVEQ